MPDAVPPPKWRRHTAKPRASTQDLLQRLRQELWGDALQALRFYQVRPQLAPPRTRHKLSPPLAAAVLCASP